LVTALRWLLSRRTAFLDNFVSLDTHDLHHHLIALFSSSAPANTLPAISNMQQPVSTGEDLDKRTKVSDPTTFPR
jgi:hypothetical protein